uniref:Uncharacterized protein n=1 Tax=Hucho hucho TaxID=62062 RepID=A0A4W5PPK0_9TELE
IYNLKNEFQSSNLSWDINIEKYDTYHCLCVSSTGQYPTMYSVKEQVFNCIQRWLVFQTIAALVYRFSYAWGYYTGGKTIFCNEMLFISYSIMLYILML